MGADMRDDVLDLVVAVLDLIKQYAQECPEKAKALSHYALTIAALCDGTDIGPRPMAKMIAAGVHAAGQVADECEKRGETSVARRLFPAMVGQFFGLVSQNFVRVASAEPRLSPPTIAWISGTEARIIAPSGPDGEPPEAEMVAKSFAVLISQLLTNGLWASAGDSKEQQGESPDMRLPFAAYCTAIGHGLALAIVIRAVAMGKPPACSRDILRGAIRSIAQAAGVIIMDQQAEFEREQREKDQAAQPN